MPNNIIQMRRSATHPKGRIIDNRARLRIVVELLHCYLPWPHHNAQQEDSYRAAWKDA